MIIVWNRQVYFALKNHEMRRLFGLSITVLEEDEEILNVFKEE